MPLPRPQPATKLYNRARSAIDELRDHALKGKPDSVDQLASTATELACAARDALVFLGDRPFDQAFGATEPLAYALKRAGHR